MPFFFPRIYPIIDASVIPVAGRAHFLHALAGSLAEAGVTLMEYRNKNGPDEQMANDAAILRAAMPRPDIKLILDDRAELVAAFDFDGVHVDAGDVSPTDARRQLGEHRIIGTFGGGEELVPGILNAPADYFSIGPVYATTTKSTSKRWIGPEGVRSLRAQAGPAPVLVAVGGITLETAPRLIEAGASMVAVAAAIFQSGNPAGEFSRWKSVLE
jgi:thiamine-phosphate pyrophosphorylase